MAANFEFKFIGNQGFAISFEDSNTTGTRELDITFPDESKLMFRTSTNTYPSFIYRSNVDDYNSAILADLNEWQIGTERFIYLPFENLVTDVGYYPSMYVDENGDNKSFSNTTVPSGIYTVRAKLTIGNDVQLYNETDQFITTESVNECIAEKVDQLQEYSCTSCKDYQEAMKLTMSMMMIRDAALWDYAKGYIEEANNKFSSLDNVCEKGLLNYITGC